MSRLADVLASLRAAIWLRLELLRARRARRAGGGLGGADDAIVAMLSAVPVEGVDHEPVELDAELAGRLDVTVAELLERAPAASAPPRHRVLRAVTATVGAFLAVAVVGASASALIAGTTGVGAVDRFLGIWEAGLEKTTNLDAHPGRVEQGGPASTDVRPSEAGPTVLYDIVGGSSGKIVSYVGADRHVCMVNSFDSNGAGRARCESIADVAASLERNGSAAFGLDAIRGVVMYGQVDADVESVSVSGPTGPMDVALGEQWARDVATGAMRPFVATAALDADASRDRAFDWSQYTVSVRRDGETLVLVPN